MRFSLLLIFIITFLMNGCLTDRIQQRRLAQQQLTYITPKQAPQKIYKPSKSLLVEESFTTPKKKTKTTKKYTVTKKRTVKKYSKKRKKTKKRATKRKKKIIKKSDHEPYSIKKNETDPELLGPQTTLESNPLAKKSI